MFGLTSVISSGRAQVLAPIFLARDKAYRELESLSYNKETIMLSMVVVEFI